jgi:ElaB/YqjD/DUF883 family membrane-anchored ribosome-binding protein
MKRWGGPAHGRLWLAAWALIVAIGDTGVELQAQETPPAGVPAEAAAEQPATAAEQPPAAEVSAETDLLAPEQLDILVAPVALYPDPLLVLVLQGSTFPVDVVAAHRFLGKLPEQPDLQPDPDWDSSIVGLLNYPEVVARMDAELDWTQALGDAVLNQLEDVQGSIQQVRLQAYTAGMLATNEQQVVTGRPDLIIVLPADETKIFVPTYDPAAVLAAEPVPLPSVEAAAEAPAEPEPQAAAETPAEPESAEAVAEAPVEPASATYVQPAMAPATYQGPTPLPPVYATAPPVVQYSDPSPSFWSGAATFAGGAAIGGLLGYIIGDDDDNDWDWNNDDDWDDVADDVDDIADDVDQLTEGFEDFRQDAGDRLDELAAQREQRLDEAGNRLDEAARNRQEQREEVADQLQQGREDRADALAQRQEQRADQREEVAQNREKTKEELRDKHQSHQAKQVQDQLRQRKGLPETGGDRAGRQRVAALGDGSANVAGIAPASVKRQADAPGLAARKPSAATRSAAQRRPDVGAVATRSPTLAKAEAAKPVPRRPGAQVAAAQPKSAFTSPKPAREVKKQSVRGASSRSSSKTKAIAQGGGRQTVARSGGQRRSAAQAGGGRPKSALASSNNRGGKVQRSASRGKASRGGGGKRGGGGRRR